MILPGNDSVPHRWARATTLALFAGAIGCSAPTGPTLSLAAAKAVLPVADAVIAGTTQPVTLTVQNAITTQSTGAVTDTFEVATEPAFSTIVATKSLPQSAGEQTSVTFDSLAPATYYWRVRASAGGAEVTSATKTFRIAAVLQAPALLLPANGFLIGSPVTLSAQNPAMPPSVTAVTDTFEVATDAAFTNIVASTSVPQTAGEQTSVTLGPLVVSATYYWRVSAAATDAIGATSATSSFRIAAVLVTPVDRRQLVLPVADDYSCRS
jgi:hypothetical protein